MLVRAFCAYFPPVIWCSKKNVKKIIIIKRFKKIKNKKIMTIKLINNKSKPALRLKQRPCMHATAPLILSLCIAENDSTNYFKKKHK